MSNKETVISAEIIADDRTVPHDFNRLLSRSASALALTNEGFPVSVATLATMATRGGGPPYQLFGRRALYRWGDSLKWARGRLSPPMANTSQATVSLAVKLAPNQAKDRAATQASKSNSANSRTANKVDKLVDPEPNALERVSPHPAA
jgi:hypothetical protein